MNEPQSQIMEENGKRYRMLQVGETIEEGDEVRLDKKWIALDGKHLGVLISDPETNFGYPAGYYRRECK